VPRRAGSAPTLERLSAAGDDRWLGLQERAGTGVQYRTRAPRDAMSCTLKSVGEVRPRRPSANHDPGPTPSAGVVLIPEPCPTAAPWQLRATRFDSRRCAGPCSSAGARPRSGAAPDAGSRARGTVPPERRGLHGAGQRVRRTPHCRRRNRNGVPLPQLASCSGLSGLVRYQSRKAAPPSVGSLDRAWDRIPIHEGPIRGSIRPQIERRFGSSGPRRFYGAATGRRAARAVRLTYVLRERSGQ